MSEFYVPYNQIKYFTEKQGDIYRHNLAHRLYLYLAHFHHGRIKWSNRKHLVKTFKSSHTAIFKAMAHLSTHGLIDVKKGGWIQVTGKDKLQPKLLSKTGRDFNIEFKFTYNLLFDRLKFNNHLFLTLFQASAMLRGKKLKSKAIPLTNLSDCRMQGEDQSEGSESTKNANNPGFIQLQSSTYLAMMTDRHPATTFKRNKKIDLENHYLKNPDPLREKERGNRTALTKDGFNTKHFSEIVGFRDRESAQMHLNKLKTTDKSFNGCYVMEANHGGFVIVKHIPNEYLFRVQTKKSFSNFDFDFSNLQTSP